VDVPLRFQLRYDPVFLELGRRFRGEAWGRPTGVSAHAAVARGEQRRELVVFLRLLFGRPDSAIVNDFGTFEQFVFFYLPRYAMQLTLSRLPPEGYGNRDVAVVGSVAFERGLLEFRWGAERLLSFTSDGAAWTRIALPEGDGRRYREAESGGEARLVTDRDESEAELFADSLPGAGR